VPEILKDDAESDARRQKSSHRVEVLTRGTIEAEWLGQSDKCLIRVASAKREGKIATPPGNGKYFLQ